MINYVKKVPVSPEETTLNAFLATLEKDNEYIRRIRQDKQYIIIETGYNLSGQVNKKWR